MVLDVILLHPLQGVDTMLVTSDFTGWLVIWAFERGGGGVCWEGV